MAVLRSLTRRCARIRAPTCRRARSSPTTRTAAAAGCRAAPGRCRSRRRSSARGAARASARRRWRCLAPPPRRTPAGTAQRSWSRTTRPRRPSWRRNRRRRVSLGCRFSLAPWPAWRAPSCWPWCVAARRSARRRRRRSAPRRWSTTRTPRPPRHRHSRTRRRPRRGQCTPTAWPRRSTCRHGTRRSGRRRWRTSRRRSRRCSTRSIRTTTARSRARSTRLGSSARAMPPSPLRSRSSLPQSRSWAPWCARSCECHRRARA
mmetsp:Transcript_90953/g.262166  ORF Transcript_90953/g.262166 Transcript_90953/m.262166 type:complete len:261 (-) Transcript_90953:58-840(-)